MQNQTIITKILITLRQVFMIVGVILFVVLGVVLLSSTATPAVAHDLANPQPEVGVGAGLSR